MKKFWLLCSCLILSGVGLFAQEFNLSGFVRDAESGEPIIGAQIVDAATHRGVFSNQQGYFNLVIPSGHRHIQVHYMGYFVVNDSIYMGRNTEYHFNLETDPYYDEAPFDEVETEKSDEPVLPSPVEIPPKQIRLMPPVFGEVDLIKNLQTTTGVQAGLEGSGGFYIRGGTPDQNLVLLDGVPVYNIYHAFGFFSIYNSEAINNVSLYKGGFPARFGSRLSSVLDLSMKDGDAQSFHGAASLSLIGFNGYLEGPLVKDKTTFSISGRRSLPPILFFLNPLTTYDDNEETGAYFYDISAKIAHRISDKEKLTFSYYRGKDRFYSKITTQSTSGNTRIEEVENAQLDWATNTGAIRYTRLKSPRMFASYSLSYTDYAFNIRQGFSRTSQSDTSRDEQNYELRYLNGIRDFAAKADYEWKNSNQHTLRFGGWYMLHAFGTGAIEAQFTGSGNNLDTLLGPEKRVIGNEFAAYIEDDIIASEQLRINLGMRVSAFFVNNKAYFAGEPRLAFRYTMGERWAFKASYSYNNQYLHMISNSGVGLPTDLWLPVTENIKPQNSQQFTAGITRTVHDDIEVGLEGYYKSMKNVLDYAEGISFNNAQINWEDRVAQGIGRAYGLEFLVQKKYGSAYGWLGYTLAWNQRKIDGINQGEWYYYRYDRRHQVNVMYAFPISRRGTISFNFTYGTGYPITFPYGRYLDANGREVFDYEKKNGYRLRYYLRLDVGYINTRENVNSGIKQEFFLAVYNLFNRSNPYYLYIGTNANTGVLEAREVSFLPFFPSLTYRISF